jgi:hypothetical protein
MFKIYPAWQIANLEPVKLADEFTRSCNLQGYGYSLRNGQTTQRLSNAHARTLI